MKKDKKSRQKKTAVALKRMRREAEIKEGIGRLETRVAKTESDKKCPKRARRKAKKDLHNENSDENS